MKLTDYLNSIIKIYENTERDSFIKTIIKIILWKFNTKFFKFSIIYQFYKDLKIIINPKSFYGAMIFYMNLPDYEEMSYMLKILKKNDVFIDIGANIGAYSLLASSKIKTGRIFSFEPNFFALEILKRNIDINNINNIYVRNEVISERSGQVRFESHETTEISKINSKIGKIHKSIKLDYFAEKEKIENIKLIKIDVEGAEPLVIKGAQTLLKKKIIKNILFELNNNIKNFGFSESEFCEFLVNYGYKIYFIKNKNINKFDYKNFDFTDKTINLLAKI